ncbi:MAG TPA: helix-turn-helix transcriptional regulator [Nannocystaceae bacterium]|nr:helix-turn-helix transcriptional regulator [Nannocystaceae bacterium]
MRHLLAKNVARLRVACGFPSVVALARAAGIGKTRLYEILAGRCDTSIDIVALLAVAFGVRACELLAVS